MLQKDGKLTGESIVRLIHRSKMASDNRRCIAVLRTRNTAIQSGKLSPVVTSQNFFLRAMS
jgi:hypothetical protein